MVYLYARELSSTREGRETRGVCLCLRLFSLMERAAALDENMRMWCTLHTLEAAVLQKHTVRACGLFLGTTLAVARVGWYSRRPCD